MTPAQPIDAALVSRMYLEQRLRPDVIAQQLGCSRWVVEYRLKTTGARTDPRASQPFRTPPPRASTGDPPPPGGYQLATLVTDWLARDGRRVGAISRAVEVDHASLYRVARGERGLGADTAARLADVLQLSPLERDRLFTAAGHVPPSLQRLGGWTDALAAQVAQLLDQEQP